MMIVKAFEILDKATFIPVIAISMRWSDDEAELYLLRRAGFGPNSDCVILCRMEAAGVDRNATYDPYSWGGRTYPVAHKYIESNFHKLESGAVIDVEFILGESTQPKKSEREETIA